MRVVWPFASRSAISYKRQGVLLGYQLNCEMRAPCYVDVQWARRASFAARHCI